MKKILSILIAAGVILTLTAPGAEAGSSCRSKRTGKHTYVSHCSGTQKSGGFWHSHSRTKFGKNSRVTHRYGNAWMGKTWRSTTHGHRTGKHSWSSRSYRH